MTRAALFLLVGLTLTAAACSKQQNTNPSGLTDKEPAFIIGYPVIPAANISMDAMRMNRRIAAEAFGGKLITEDWDISAEGTIRAVKNLIARGAGGVIVVPTDESILPTITNICEEAEVYWSIAMREIHNEAIKKIAYSSKYYVGYIHEPGFDLGYKMGRVIGESGVKTYAIISGSSTDSDSTIREAGLNKAAEEYGMEQIAAVRNLSEPSDAVAAVESIVGAYPDIDAIVRVTTRIAWEGIAICRAIDKLEKKDDIFFISSITEEGLGEYLKSGVCDYAFADILPFDSLLASVILCNAITGTPVSNEKVEINLYTEDIDSILNFNYTMEYLCNPEIPLFSIPEIQDLMVGRSLQYIQKNVIDRFSIQSVVERNGAL